VWACRDFIFFFASNGGSTAASAQTKQTVTLYEADDTGKQKVIIMSDTKVFHDSKLEHELEEQHDEQVTQGCGVCGGCGGFCGWVDRNRIISILLFASIGAAVGVGLSFWEPDDPDSKKVCIQWLGLIGDLFIRALKCFVLPLVFVNGTSL
jgi:hypothetical protein